MKISFWKHTVWHHIQSFKLSRWVEVLNLKRVNTGSIETTERIRVIRIKLTACSLMIIFVDWFTNVVTNRPRWAMYVVQEVYDTRYRFVIALHNYFWYQTHRYTIWFCFYISILTALVVPRPQADWGPLTLWGWYISSFYFCIFSQYC